jgi:predicted nucleic acid-binding Zn ribbon protein
MPRSYDQCVRCGKATPWGKSVCRECNPAGLPEPSPSQYHATVFITVLATLVVLAVIAMLLR